MFPVADCYGFDRARAPVNRLTMLVTSDGQWVFENDPAFLDALGDPAPDYDAASFAVKNLGFIKFQLLDDSVIEIELHPRNVELPALLAIQQQLLTSNVRLFRIKYFDTSWKSEIIPAAELAVSRLSEMCAPAFAPPASSKFIVEPLDYNVLFSDSENPFGLMAQKWRMSFGAFDPTVISFAIQHQLLSRMMILGVKQDSPDPTFRFIGDGFRWLANDYQFNGVGQRMENLPDKEYGAWAAAFYKSVARSGQPRYDIVRAAIQTSPTAPSAYRTRYERLLLPWKTPSDEIFVSLCSRVLANDASADVEDMEAEKSRNSTSAKSS
jgi:hypothetical protein